MQCHFVYNFLNLLIIQKNWWMVKAVSSTYFLPSLRAFVEALLKVTICMALQTHYLYATKVAPYDTGLDCTIQWDSASHRWKLNLLSWVLAFFLISLSAIVLTILYSSIIISLHRRKINLHLANEMIKKRESRNRKIAVVE